MEYCYKFNISARPYYHCTRTMTLNPKSLPKGSTKRKSIVKGSSRMTAGEEKAVTKAYQEIKEGKVRTFKDADEYLKYLDTV